ncbi:hypothetical protein [Micromonospora sp. NBC_01638]|uniref:hypothetical protein n=1 Tax=Micromonospora sp. NBC_01638 TaxID=2975982 RepID=UPI00386FD687|nr:hypothetical protein OG811_15815 [Micromonospora sp. NBC_01638]
MSQSKSVGMVITQLPTGEHEGIVIDLAGLFVTALLTQRSGKASPYPHGVKISWASGRMPVLVKVFRKSPAGVGGALFNEVISARFGGRVGMTRA